MNKLFKSKRVIYDWYVNKQNQRIYYANVFYSMPSQTFCLRVNCYVNFVNPNHENFRTLYSYSDFNNFKSTNGRDIIWSTDFKFLERLRRYAEITSSGYIAPLCATTNRT